MYIPSPQPPSDPTKLDNDRVARYLAYFIEKGAHYFAPLNRFVVVLNTDGAGKSNFSMAMFKGLLTILEDNFGERAGALYLGPASWWLKVRVSEVSLYFLGFVSEILTCPIPQMLWAMVKPFLHPLTRTKFKLFGVASELNEWMAGTVERGWDGGWLLLN